VRSLFLKIFLWFGLAMVLVNVASFVTGVITERRSQFLSHGPMSTAFAVYAQTAAELFEKDGQAALASYLERIERASRIQAVLFNESGQEVSGRPVSVGVEMFAKRVTRSSPYVFEFRRSQPDIAARLVQSSTGDSYTLVGQLPKPDFPPPPPRLGEPGSFRFGLRMLGQRLLPVLLIGALLCYWLARYLSKPIVELRKTTQELADGDFNARVNHTLLKRHDEIGYLGRDFNLMASRIGSLVEAQKRLLGDISHELRSPLARQNVAIGLARRQANSDLNGNLDRIAREADRLSEMIGQLLTLSRAEIGTEGPKVKIDLSLLVHEITENANFEARARNRSVRVTNAEDCKLTGVLELLHSAIENVVRNAVRYTAPGTEVEVSVQRDGRDTRYAVISVRDHGPGVRAEDIDEIFRPFYRVEDSRDRMSGGSGLGLAISDRAVRLHGGSIKARNAPGGGLIVEIRIPIE
jgi:two-component system, OmpR family, sensor histidine kinase CpxA